MKIWFKAIWRKKEEIGKIIKSSKNRLIWKFKINDKLCFLVFSYSNFSGNFAIALNKKLIYAGNDKSKKDFKFTFTLE